MKNFDKSWELEYSKGNALNEYPFDFIVTLTFKYFGKVKNKGLNGKFKKMYFEDIQDIDEKFDLIVDRESIYSLEWSDVVKTYSHISTKLKKTVFLYLFLQ